jgi:hypothetical protein
MISRLAILSSHAPGQVRKGAFPGRSHGGSARQGRQHRDHEHHAHGHSAAADRSRHAPHSQPPAPGSVVGTRRR